MQFPILAGVDEERRIVEQDSVYAKVVEPKKPLLVDGFDDFAMAAQSGRDSDFATGILNGLESPLG